MVIYDILQVSNDAKDLFIEAHVNGAEYYKGYTIDEIYINTQDNFLETGVNTKDYIYHKKFTLTQTKFKFAIYKNNVAIAYYTPTAAYIDENFSEEYDSEVYNNLPKDEYDIHLYHIEDEEDSRNFFSISDIDGERELYFELPKALPELDNTCSVKIVSRNALIYPTKIQLKINCNEVNNISDFSSSLLFVYIKVRPEANDCSACIPCGMDGEYTIGVTFDTGLLYNIGMNYINELSDNCSIPQGFSDFVLNWEGFKMTLESEHYIDAVNMFNKLFLNKSKTFTSNCGCNGKLSI